MKKLIRFLVRTSLFLLLVLIGIIIIRTISYSSKQIEVKGIEKIQLDDEVVQRLAGAIGIPTISGTDGIDSSSFRALRNYIESSYPLVDSLLEKTPINEFSLIFKWPGKNPNLKPVLLMAHLDVVPIEEATRNNWKAPPFEAQIKDGFLWGRGTLDDKNNVFGILDAVELLLKENYLPGRTVYLAFGHDEEISGKNGAASIVAHLKKQKVELEYVLDEGMLILEDGFPGLDRPLALIGISEKGYATLSLTVQLQEGGHSSMPPRETAIGILSQAISKLQNHPFPAKLDGPARQLLDYAGPETAMPFKAIFANLWLFRGMLKTQFSGSASTNAILRTTTAPTIFTSGVKDNVLPSLAKATVNFRILPGNSIAFVKDYVEKTIGDPRVSIELANPDFAQEASPVSSTEAFGFNVLEKTIREIFPESVVAPSLVVGATDSRFYSALTPNVYRFMPVILQNKDLSRIHGINEKISIENYKNTIRFYKQLILNSCK